MKNDKVIRFLRGHSPILCTNIPLDGVSDKKNTIPFTVSDTILHFSYVFDVFQKFSNSTGTCISKFSLNTQSLSFEDSALRIVASNAFESKQASLKIYFVNKIGTIQPCIITNANESLVFDKIKFGELTYLFFDTRNSNLVKVLSTTIQYN